MLRENLIQLIRQKSYREGDFTLASGKKSKFYIDLKPTTLHPCGIDWISTLVVQYAAKAGLDVDGVGGLTLGADPLSTAVSLKFLSLLKKEVPALIVRKESKSHGTSQFIEGTENLKSGSKIWVAEDVVTTGGSSLKAIERLRAAQYKVEDVFAVVDREEGGKEALQKMDVKLWSIFKISDLRN